MYVMFTSPATPVASSGLRRSSLKVPPKKRRLARGSLGARGAFSEVIELMLAAVERAVALPSGTEPPSDRATEPPSHRAERCEAPRRRGALRKEPPSSERHEAAALGGSPAHHTCPSDAFCSLCLHCVFIFLHFFFIFVALAGWASRDATDFAWSSAHRIGIAGPELS